MPPEKNLKVDIPGTDAGGPGNFWMEIAGLIICFWKMRKEITSEKGVIIRQKRSRCPIKN